MNDDLQFPMMRQNFQDASKKKPSKTLGWLIIGTTLLFGLITYLNTGNLLLSSVFTGAWFVVMFVLADAIGPTIMGFLVTRKKRQGKQRRGK